MRKIALSRAILNPRASCRGAGFTLIELLVVIGVVSILMAMLLPTVNKARDSVAKVNCASNQRQLFMAVMMYANESQGYIPFVARSGLEWDIDGINYSNKPGQVPVAGAFNVVKRVTRSPDKILVCPSRTPESRNGDNRFWNIKSGFSYKDGFSTYVFYAGSRALRTGAPAGSYDFPTVLYYMKLHKLPNNYAVFSDVLAYNSSGTHEPTSADAWLVQSNHLVRSRIKPSGGNVCYMDGHTEWVDFRPATWYNPANLSIYAPIGTRPLNSYTSYTSSDPYFFSGSAGVRGRVVGPY